MKSNELNQQLYELKANIFPLVPQSIGTDISLLTIHLHSSNYYP